MTVVIIELPDYGRVAAEAAGRGELNRVVVAPPAVGVAEGADAGGRREAGADEAEDAGG